MKTTLIFSSVAGLFLLLSACQQAPDGQFDPAQTKTEIQGIENTWAEAMNTKDVEALMALYADDAIVLADGEPMLVGKDAIRKDQEKGMAMMPEGQQYSFEVMDVYGDANQVTEVGKTTIKDAAGNVTGTGKYMCIFEKQDGNYRLVREIYNNDKKAGPAGSKSIHLFDLPTDVTEAEWAAALKDMNAVIAGMGYPNAGYHLYKTEAEDTDKYRYYFEGVWPSAEAYTKIHEDPAFIAASEKSGALYDKIKKVEIYRRVVRVD